MIVVSIMLKELEVVIGKGVIGGGLWVLMLDFIWMVSNVNYYLVLFDGVKLLVLYYIKWLVFLV